MSGALDTARAAWGEDMPDWVRALATACEETTQSAVARRLKLSGGFVSQTLRRTYAGAGYATIEEAVRGALMGSTIECPALGTLPADECRHWRGRAKAFVNTNSLRVRMFHACNACPRNAAAGDRK